MKKISAIIAVRKGSKRIPNKNIKTFSDTSLLENKINQLVRLNVADEIIVSSDCDIMLSKAANLGAKAIKRDPLLASDSIAMNTVYRYLSTLVKYEHVLFVHVTSPLLEDESLMNCVEEYSNLDSKYDSLATVSRVEEYIWNKNGAVNYDPNNHPRSQDLPKWYCLNFAVNIIPRDLMFSRKNIVGKKFYPFFLSKEESIDVDNPIDFRIAEFLYNLRKEKK